MDVDLIRRDPEVIRTMLRNRNYSEETLDEFLRLDKEWRRLVDESNGLKHKRNVASERIPKLKGEEKKDAIAEMRGVAERIKQIDAMIADLEAQRDEVVLNIPNLPDASVPVGCDYAGNRTVSSFGKPRELDFTPKKHYEIGEDLDIIDFQRGAKITGSGFYILKGDGARLERALIQYMLDVHHDQGYREVFTPAIVNTAAVIGTGQYPKMKDDMYWCERDDLWLNPTAEVPVTNMHQDEIFEREQLPISYAAYLPSFRREAGRNADTRGIIRVHQSTRWSWSSSSIRPPPSRNWRSSAPTPRRSCGGWSCLTAPCCSAQGTWASPAPRPMTWRPTRRGRTSGWRCPPAPASPISRREGPGSSSAPSLT